jgi:hypothetical protein
MYGGKRREDEEQQNRQNQRQEAETPAVGSARDRLRQRASAMGEVTGQREGESITMPERKTTWTDKVRSGGRTGNYTTVASTPEQQESVLRKGLSGKQPRRTDAEQAESLLRKGGTTEAVKASKKTGGKFDVGDYSKLLGESFAQGVAEGTAGTLAAGETLIGKGLDKLFPGAGFEGSGFFNALYNGRPDWKFFGKNGLVGIRQSREYTQQKLAEDVEDIETGSELGTKVAKKAATFGGDVAYGMGNALPMAAEAVITGGTSLLPTTTKELETLGINVVQKSGLAGKLEEAAKLAGNTLRSREYWTSFFSEVGMDYYEALDNGATEDEATRYALSSAMVNSVIEIGGGIQKIPEAPTFRTWIKGAHEEGMEEIQQGIVSRLMENAVYDKKNPLVSVTDENAVVNPVTAANEYAGGFAVGGLLGGVQQGMAKRAQTRQEAELAQYQESLDKLGEKFTPAAKEMAQERLSLDSEDYTAQKVMNALDSGEAVSGEDIRTLIRDNVNAHNTAALAEIKEKIAQRLTDLGETKDANAVADAMVRYFTGETRGKDKASRKQRAADQGTIFRSRYGDHVGQELMQTKNVPQWVQGLPSLTTVYEYEQAHRPVADQQTRAEAPAAQAVETAVEQGTEATEQSAEPEKLTSAIVRKAAASRETLEQLGIDPQGKTGSQLRAEVRQALTERQAVAQQVAQQTQETQEMQETQETQGTAQQTQGTPVTLEEASKAYGKQAKAFLRTYQQGQDVEKFSEAYRIAHEMGESNVPYRVVQGLRSLDYLTEAQKDIAYRTGASAEKQERSGKKATWRRQGVVRAENGANLSDLSKTFNVPQKQGYRILSAIAKATGVDIVLYRSKGDAEGNITEAEGRFRRSENTIYIDVNSGIDNVSSTADFSQYTMLRTFNHEFTHFIENADEEYRELRKLVFEVMQEKLDGQGGGVTVDDLIREKQDKYRQALGQEISYDEASREVVADAMTDILPDSYFMETLYNRNATLAEKLIGKLKDFIAKVKAYFDGLTTNTKAEAALLKEMRDGGLHYLERIVKAYDKAATAAVENYQGAETRSEGGETQYMARGKYWRPQLKQAEWDLLERRMNAEIKSGENFLDEATKWVYADEKGVQVFALYGIGDGTDATPLYAVGGKKAAACKTDITDYVEGRKNADRNGRSADSWIEQFQSKKRSRGRNLSEAQEQTGTAGTADELYGGQQGRNLGGYSGRGTENQRGVKDQFSIRDSEGRSLTEAQQDYFKDSKVRDAEGRLKVVYHGSGAVFTKFSADFMSQNGSSEGQGFYFTDYKPMAEGYSKKGGQLLEGYLDMKKPLSDSEVTLTSAEVRKLIKAIDPTGDDLVLNYDSKGGMGYPSRAWYNRSVEDTLRATMSTSDSDSEILAELANGMGNPGAVLKAAREVLGYDGYIVEGKYDNATVYVAFDSSQFKNVDNQSPTAAPDIRYSIREIKGEDGTNYGKGVYLDSTLLEGLTDAERKEMMRERVKELGGQTITAYDPNGEAVDIRIAAPSEKFRNRNGRKVPVTKDLSTKRNGTKVEQESVVLADELIATSRYERPRKAKYPHGWLDNNGKNDWQYWTTYIQDKNNTVWEATLNVAESANGVKYLYDIDPIEKVGQSVKSDTSTTSVGQSVKSDTSTTGDIVAQNQTESQAQIRSSTLSDRDVLRIAAQMAKNSESRSLTDADRARLGIIEQKLGRIDDAEEQRQGFLEEKRAILAGREAKELSDAERAQLRKVQKNLDTVNGKIRRLNEELSQTQEKKVVRALLKKARVVVERDAVQRSVSSYRETRQRAEYMGKLRRSVERNAKRLQEMLLTNTDKKHVPEALKKPVAELLRSMNLISKRGLAGGAMTKADERYVKALRGIQDVLARQSLYEESGKGDDLIGGYLDLPAGFQMLLNAYVSKVEKAIEEHPLRNGVLQTMTVEELEETNTVLSVISTAVTEMNKLMVNRQFATVVDAAEDTIWALNEHEQHQRKTGENFLVWDNCLPWYAFQRFGEGGKSIFQGLMNGWDKLAFNIQKVLDFRNGLIDDKTARKWDTETHTVMLESSKGGQEEVTLTTAQLMSLYCLSRRKQAMGHLMGGGIRIASIDIAEEIESARAAEEGKPVREKKKKKKDVDQAEHYLLTQGELGRLLSLLTPEQVQAAKAMQRYMTEQGSAWGNEVSMRRFGYRAFTEENYFPIETDSQDRPAKTDSKEGSLYRLLNISAVKPLTEGANNAIMVRSIFDVFANHMADMAKYNALALPVLDAQKWYNYKDSSKNKDNGQVRTRTVQREMTRAWGSGANNYVVTFLKDINGVKENGARGEGMAAKAISKYKRAAVAANLRVAMLQPTSYVRASAVIDHKYLAKALTKKVITKAEGQEMLQYSGIALWKEMGFFDTDVGRSIRDQIKGKGGKIEDLVDKSMAAAQAGDKITWERLWLACKLEVEEKRHLTGEELMEATAERFREVIYRTQVVDSTMTRSHMMRDGGTFSKIATSFMSESTVSYNLLMNSTLDTLQDAQSMGMQKAVKKNWRQLGRAYQAYILAGAASAIAGALADALRDWDDDSFLEKFWKAFWGEKPETVKDQVLNLMLGLEGNLAGELNPLSKIPLIRDVTNTFGGFSTDRMDMAAWSNLYSLLGIWEETIGLWTGSLDKATKTTYYGNMTTYNKIYKTAQVVSQFTGLPISATMRELVTMWNSTVGLAYPGTKVRTYESRKVREAYEQYGKSVGLSYVMILRAAEAVRQLESDKDEDGNAISGSLKKKYVEYIQSLHLSAKQEKAMWNCIKKTAWSDKDTPWGK